MEPLGQPASPSPLPSTVIPPAPAKPKRKRTLLIAIGVLVLVILIAVAGTVYFYATHSVAYGRLKVRMDVFWSSLIEPGDVRHATFVLSPRIGGGVYTDSGTRFRLGLPGADAGETILDFAKAGKSEAYLVLEGLDSRDMRVVVDGKTVYSSSVALRDISLSPDARYVAFAVASSSASAKQVFEDSSVWSVLVIDLSTGKALDPLRGFSPLFAGPDTLIRFTPTSVLFRTLSTGVESPAKNASFAFLPSVRPAISRDGSLLAWSDAETAKTFVYKIHDVAPRLELMATLSVPPSGAIAITPHALYYFYTHVDQPTELMQYPLDGSTPKKVRTFPAALPLLKMLP